MNTLFGILVIAVVGFIVYSAYKMITKKPTSTGTGTGSGGGTLPDEIEDEPKK